MLWHVSFGGWKKKQQAPFGENRGRILILTADYGYGHRSAANAIAGALQETHGNDC
jgi:hypothetical protein